MRLPNLFGSKKTESEREVEEFQDRRKHERIVFESALKEWLLKSGLADVMMKQMAPYAEQCGIEPWPNQFNHYTRIDFDPRRQDHREIAERIEHAYDEHDVPSTVHLVSQPDAEPENRLVRAYRTRAEADAIADGHPDLRVDEVKVEGENESESENR